jgi:hypothetical protein
MVERYILFVILVRCRLCDFSSSEPDALHCSMRRLHTIVIMRNRNDVSQAAARIGVRNEKSRLSYQAGSIVLVSRAGRSKTTTIFDNRCDRVWAVRSDRVSDSSARETFRKVACRRRVTCHGAWQTSLCVYTTDPKARSSECMAH